MVSKVHYFFKPFVYELTKPLNKTFYLPASPFDEEERMASGALIDDG